MATLVKNQPTESRVQRQLRTLLRQAHQNERILRRLQALELLLIGTSSLKELTHMILDEYRASFDLDSVSLFLVDPEFEIQRILEEDDVNLDDEQNLIFAPAWVPMKNLELPPMFPILEPYSKAQHSSLFTDTDMQLVNIAILPLVRHGKFIGSLNLGSTMSERLVAGTATDFLERIAAIIAICVENTLNYERLKRTGLTDPLTAINNRRFFDQRLSEERDRAWRDKIPLSCLFIDVDHFKSINDSYGHHIGDVALKKIARQLNTQMRRSDVLARHGGEEFSILLSSTSSNEAWEIAERIRKSIARQPLELPDGNRHDVTVSIGIATIEPVEGAPRPTDKGKSLIDSADMALLEAKQGGRNRVSVSRFPD